ncbi:MAG: hypothetical protein R2795_03115 [Saprospiraceae bacterium]
MSNGGETLTLTDADGNIVDEVTFDDSFPWPTSPDGFGASLVLCDPNADNNDGANWQAALTPTGVISGGLEIFANPGAASACSEGALVRFLSASTEVGEDAGTLNLMVQIRDAVAGTYTVDIMVDGASTATDGADASSHLLPLPLARVKRWIL